MSHDACTAREAQLEAHLFRELDDSETRELLAHVELCDGCRTALEDARFALDALGEVSDPPLPYADDQGLDRAWMDFKKRLPSAAPRPERRAYQLVAMAATLVVGIGIGRLAMDGGNGSSPSVDSLVAETASVAPEALVAFERAELLADVGVRYVEGLQGLLVDVMSLSVDAVSDDDLLLTRERAVELLEDGRLLERALDRDQDERLLRAIGRAELFLEELAAIERNGSGTSVRIFQASLERSELSSELATLDLERDVSTAIEASGWIGWDDASRKEF